jgi:hypothetical protein
LIDLAVVAARLNKESAEVNRKVVFGCLVVLIVINNIVVVTRRWWLAMRQAGLQQIGDKVTEIEMEQIAVY